MNGRIVFLLEEPSMKALLENMLPRIFPGLSFQCISHEGKTDLDKSIPKKLKAWREPGVRFVILRDNDNKDCVDLKARIKEICKVYGRPDTLIRLICQELESWYLGDLIALSRAFKDEKISSPHNIKRYANPDGWQKPSHEVAQLAPAFQKISGARSMGNHLGRNINNSTSFGAFITGLSRMAEEMGYVPT